MLVLGALAVGAYLFVVKPAQDSFSKATSDLSGAIGGLRFPDINIPSLPNITLPNINLFPQETTLTPAQRGDYVARQTQSLLVSIPTPQAQAQSFLTGTTTPQQNVATTLGVPASYINPAVNTGTLNPVKSIGGLTLTQGVAVSKTSAGLKNPVYDSARGGFTEGYRF